MDRATIADQIQKILNSEAFVGKTQIKTLLTILDQNVDSQATLKPDRVIRELWPKGGDSRSAADLAGAMTRLRKALEGYYSGEGKHDTLIIRLPDRSVRSARNGRAARWIVAESRAASQEQEAEHDSAPLPENPVVPGAMVYTPIAAATAPKPRLRQSLLMGAGILVVAVAALVVFRLMAADDEPNAGRLDGDIFMVVNAKGKELWSKSFSDGFRPEYYQNGIATRTWFGDLDGDGHTDVLFLYQPSVNGSGRSTTLICYSYRGEEKWRWKPGRTLPELGNEPPVFISEGLAVLNAAAHGVPRRIVISSLHYPFYPNQIALVDSHGKTISEYWHSGHLEHVILADLSGDGHQEIIATGIANGYHQATLILLDPDQISGASIETLRPDLQIHAMGAPKERLRILFPRSDLNTATLKYNEAQEVNVENLSVRVPVMECHLNPYCVIWYVFDRKFTLRSVYADDSFRDAHLQYYHGTRNDHPFSAEEEKQFQKLPCLAGCKTEFLPVDIR